MWILMCKWTLSRDADGVQRPAEQLCNDMILQIGDAEADRLKAVRDLLGGQEDGQKSGPNGAILFRRQDPTASGGVGYMVAAQVFRDHPSLKKGRPLS